MSTSRVGIGTRTPTEALDIVGTQIIRPITYAGNQDSAAISFAASNNSAWDNLFGIRFATDSSGVPSLRLRANGNDKLTVKQTGVGIGTDSPTEVLTVEGAVSASGGYKIGADAFVTHNTSYTLPLSDNGKTTLLDTTSGSIVITVPNLETGFSNRFIKEAGAAPVVFSVGNGLSALGSYQDRNQMSIIYAQADIFYKNENYAFLGGNLE